MAHSSEPDDLNTHEHVTSARLNEPFPLLRLPNELICNIAHQVNDHSQVQIMGRVGYEPNSDENAHERAVRQFFTAAKDLRNLALTCSRLSDIVRDVLFESPVLTVPANNRLQTIPPTYQGGVSHNGGDNTVLFLRSLIENQQLGPKVKHIRLQIAMSPENEVIPYRGAHRHVVNNQVLALVNGSMLRQDMKLLWNDALCLRDSGAHTGIIFLLANGLRHLTISGGDGPSGDLLLCTLFGRHLGTQFRKDLSSQANYHTIPESFGLIPGLAKVDTIRLETPSPVMAIGLCALPRITKLDLSLLVDSTNWSFPSFTSHCSAQFQHFTDVSLDCRLPEIGYNLEAWLIQFGNMVAQCPNIKHLAVYAEKPTYLLPNTTTLPTVSDFDLADTLRVKSSNGYSFLIQAIRQLLPDLESLTLPGGFWTIATTADFSLPELTCDLSEGIHLRKVTMPIKAWKYVTLPKTVSTVRFTEVTTKRFPNFPKIRKQGCAIELVFTKDVGTEWQARDNYVDICKKSRIKVVGAGMESEWV